MRWTQRFCQNGSLNTDLGHLLLTGTQSDATIVVKGGKPFSVHKSVLVSRSPVFAAMFDHETKEREENKIELFDISEEVCAQFLQFIYTDEVEDDSYTCELLVLANKVSYDFW